MKKLVIIGANEFQNPLIEKAKELGYETHVFAWKSGDIGEKTADYFYPISIVEKEKILEICKKINPVGVCSIGSDLANITVHYVAKNLGLKVNSDRCIQVSTNKYLMRKAMAQYGVETPKFFIADKVVEDFKNIKYPVIVKPTDRSGSRAITKVYKFEDLAMAIELATLQSFEKKAIVEEYIEGEEYSFETISYNKKHFNLAITKKFTTGSPNFIETGHVEPSGLTVEQIERVKSVVFKALDSLDIEYGASHAEFKITPNGDIKIIEIGSRMGGDCIGSDLVYLSTGYDFVKMVIDVACGNSVDFTVHNHYKKATIRFIFTQQDYAELLQFQKERKNSIYRVSKIDKELLGKATDSSSRAGYYIFVE